jgi:glycosyltransferase involved in cell wall biosynthesis
LRVVYVNPTGVLGGAEMCLLDVLAALRGARPGWSPRVLLGDDGPLRGAVAELGVACEVVPLPRALAGLGDAGLGGGPGGHRGAAGLALVMRGPAAVAATASYLARLGRAVRTAAPDVVHTNGMKAHVLGTLAAPRGVPVVWHMHDFCGSRPLMARLLWLAARRRPGGLRVVGVSHAVADDAARVLGPGVAVETVYNAVDLARFAPGPGAGAWLDALAGLPTAAPGTVRVGLVATYARWKGHDVFLEAVARVDRALPARFYVVGGPLYRTGGSQFSPGALRARAEGLGLSDRLGFVAHQSAPEAVFRALDVVVHASTRPEPFGRVIVEALACGRAVIAARAGGAAELFDDGTTALGCPPGDPDALAAAVSRLVAVPELRRTLGEAGRRAAVERFDRDGLAGAWARVYGAATDGAHQAREGTTAPEAKTRA